MKTRCHKLMVLAVAVVCVASLVWTFWLRPRQIFHGYVDGEWSAYSSVTHKIIDGNSVISFRSLEEGGTERIIEQLNLSIGAPGGNTDELCDRTLSQAGYNPNEFSRYFDYERSIQRGILCLYAGSRESVIVVLRY